MVMLRRGIPRTLRREEPPEPDPDNTGVGMVERMTFLIRVPVSGTLF